ncbi:MAG: ABC transporter permease [Gammaproteobacteria bacterium]|uniref:Transport permease protein n=1 Tax=SAR86 cluster bacterium TaxID=2030880 RepID=A0A520N050_9GAMM|nr:ABC transporter permease [Gammaproteobacteria bacterium]RZO26860.1 MAG: ABC transporter permease [SAR86 cluster bacterium]|tara:strand:+ start:3162 stop:3935 length:774 start_codon:yes stop_codon:yes gene_type:complete
MNNLQALRTLAYANVRRILRIWIQTILPPAITTALYFLIFGSLIGSRIGNMPGYEGLSYIEFMVPGLIMLSVITNSYANVASAFFGTKFQKSIEEIIVSPMPAWVILIGFLAGGIARGVIVGIVVVLTSLFFVDISINNYFLTCFSIIITSLLFSLLGLMNGIYARNFDDVSIVPTFVLTPLIYLGGIFYSINILSPEWQIVSQLNPILYIVNFFRYAMLGQSEIEPMFGFSLIVLFTLIFSGISYYLILKGTGIKE